MRNLLSLTNLTGFGQNAPSIIVSVQQKAITIPLGSTSGTASISAVNTAKSIIIHNGFECGDATQEHDQCMNRVELTNNTTVTAYINTANNASDIVVQCVVVEFQPWAISSIQSGQIALSGVASNTATINAVNVARSCVIWLGATTTHTADNFGRSAVQLTLTNSTTVTAARFNTNDAAAVGYMVVEFDPSVVISVQAAPINILVNNTTGTAAINAVTTKNSLLFYGGWKLTTTASTSEARAPYAQLTNATTVTATRTGASATVQSDIAVTVVEFSGQYVSSKKSGTLAITGSTQSSAVVPVYQTSKSIPTMLGLTYNSDTSSVANAFCRTFYSNGAMNATRAGLSGTLTASYELLEFAN